MAVDTTRTWAQVDNAWRAQATWSKVASGRKRWLRIWRLLAAIGGVAGAILETWAAILKEGDPARPGLAFLGGAILTIVAWAVGFMLPTGKVREWAEARSASEALKSEIFRFLAGARPYGSERNAEALTTRAEEIEGRLKNLGDEAAGVDAPIATRPNRAITAGDYITLRLSDQREWFRRKARANATVAKWLRRLQAGLAAAAALIGFGAGGADAGFDGVPALGPWVAVVTTITAAVATYLAAERFQEQAVTYFAAARRLEGIEARWTDSQTTTQPESFGGLVDASEGAISAASEAWLAEWSREESTSTP
jgi:hypothetical protein